MEPSNHLTKEHDWRAWKEACAAARCDAASEARLRRFGFTRFSGYFRRYTDQVDAHGPPGIPTEAADGWHLLETYARTGQTRAGKRYKDWLFERASGTGQPWLPAMESGASLLMRAVVREHLRREHTPAFMVSLNQPRNNDGGGESPWTLEELLPDSNDPSRVMEEREWADAARRMAGSLFPSLDFRARAALWARASGVSLCDPRLLAWTKSSQSLLYKVYRLVLDQLGAEIKKSYPGETSSALLHVTMLTLAEVTKNISDTIFVEKGAARFFKKI